MRLCVVRQPRDANSRYADGMGGEFISSLFARKSGSDSPRLQRYLPKVVLGFSLALIGIVALSLNSTDASAQEGLADALINKRMAEGSAIPDEPFTFSITATPDTCTAPASVQTLGNSSVEFQVSTTSGETPCTYTVTEVDLPEGCVLLTENNLVLDREVKYRATFGNACATIEDATINKVMADGSEVPDAPFPFTLTPSSDTCTALTAFDLLGGESLVIPVIVKDVAGAFCTYTVTEGDLPAGCSLVSENDQLVNVDFLSLTFVNSCVPLTQFGDAVVSKTMADGSDVPAEPFSFTITPSSDTCSAAAEFDLAAGASTEIPIITVDEAGVACTYTVTEGDLPVGCSIVSENGVVLNRDNKFAVTFVNSCMPLTETGEATIAKVMADGSDVPAEPFPFTITPSADTCSAPDAFDLAGGDSVEMALITVDEAGVPCTYTVTEGDLPAGCSIVSENGLVLNADNKFAVTFVNTCDLTSPVPALTASKVAVPGDSDCAATVADPMPVAAGDVVKYCITVTNSGVGPASNVTIVDDAGTPANTTDDTTFIYTDNGGVLAEGASWTVEYTVTVEAGNENVTNTAQVTAVNDKGEPTTPVEDTAVTVGGPVPALSASKVAVPASSDCGAAVADPLPVAAGDVVKFCITVTNSGVGPALNVMIVDDAGTPANTADDTTFAYTDNGGVLAEGASWTVEYTVTVEAGSEAIVNSASVTGENEFGDPTEPVTDTATTVDSPAAGLTVNKVAVQLGASCSAGGSGALVVAAGDIVKYCITVTNNGPGSAYNVVIADDSGTPGNAADDMAFTYTDNGGELIPGGSWTIEYTVVVVAGNEALTNSAQVTAENEFGRPVSAAGDSAVTTPATTPVVVVEMFEYPVITNMPAGPNGPYGFVNIENPGPVVGAPAPATTAPVEAAADSQLAHTGNSANVSTFLGLGLVGFGALALASMRKLDEDDE